jgi:hypothetical protein
MLDDQTNYFVRRNSVFINGSYEWFACTTIEHLYGTKVGPCETMLSFSNDVLCRFTSEHQLLLLNSDEIRSRNREQLIEKLERVIQEKNASITKLEER